MGRCTDINQAYNRTPEKRVNLGIGFAIDIRPIFRNYSGFASTVIYSVNYWSKKYIEILTKNNFHKNYLQNKPLKTRWNTCKNCHRTDTITDSHTKTWPSTRRNWLTIITLPRKITQSKKLMKTGSNKNT